MSNPKRPDKQKIHKILQAVSRHKRDLHKISQLPKLAPEHKCTLLEDEIERLLDEAAKESMVGYEEREL